MTKPKKDDKKAVVKPEKLKAVEYKYIGDKDAPKEINFMGLQVFKLEEATEVTNPKVLTKIENHPSFKKV